MAITKKIIKKKLTLFDSERRYTHVDEKRECRVTHAIEKRGDATKNRPDFAISNFNFAQKTNKMKI